VRVVGIFHTEILKLFEEEGVVFRVTLQWVLTHTDIYKIIPEMYNYLLNSSQLQSIRISNLIECNIVLW